MIQNKLSAKKIAFIITFTVASILINYSGSVLAGIIAFPLYLDSILTIAVVALCGLIPGLICAALSNLLLCIFAHTGILFMTCHLSTAIVAWLVFRNENKKNPSCSFSTSSFIWVGFISAITNSIIGDSISNFIYAANTSIPQVDNAVQGIYVVTRNLTYAAYFGGTMTNLVDKLICTTISLFVYRVLRRFSTDL